MEWNNLNELKVLVNTLEGAYQQRVAFSLELDEIGSQLILIKDDKQHKELIKRRDEFRGQLKKIEKMIAELEDKLKV